MPKGYVGVHIPFEALRQEGQGLYSSASTSSSLVLKLPLSAGCSTENGIRCVVCTAICCVVCTVTYCAVCIVTYCAVSTVTCCVVFTVTYCAVCRVSYCAMYIVTYCVVFTYCLLFEINTLLQGSIAIHTV